ncbi:MAG: sigma-70 family RNA polymerase sigma factor, partial [Planctomycetota bacterium]|nr:sigma-70 family RNA polymerase sigma factor [Planctomycetota bacterium]
MGTDIPDADIARAVLRGDRGVFETLVRRHEAAVFSHILRLVRNRDDALELSQDTFLKAYRHLVQYDPNRQFRVWLLAIATNTAMNHLEARRVRRMAGATLAADAGEAEYSGERQDRIEDSPPERAGRKEMLELIDAALGRLSSKARAIFSLRYNQGLSCEEIAWALGESVSNV